MLRNRAKLALMFTVSVLCMAGMTGLRTAHAQTAPRVIPITARRFEFSPNQVTLKKGEKAILRITSDDVTHGFFSRPLKLDQDIQSGDTIDIPVTPQSAGTFSVICDHFCGAGHGNMHLSVVVTE